MYDQFPAQLCVGPGIHRTWSRISCALIRSSAHGPLVVVCFGRMPVRGCWAECSWNTNQVTVTSSLLTSACQTRRRALSLSRLSPDPAGSRCAGAALLGRCRPDTVSPLGGMTLRLTEHPLMTQHLSLRFSCIRRGPGTPALSLRVCAVRLFHLEIRSLLT